ncbi:MAG: TraR/DksA C4-type zinc finger protein [Bacteroidota bacterium]
MHLTAEQKTEIKSKIEDQIIDIQQKIKELEELTKPISPDNAIGRLSRMDAINNKSVNEAGLRSAKSKLVKLERALSRIDQSDFGYCSRCKQPIKVGRILFMPESSRCVRCAAR